MSAMVVASEAKRKPLRIMNKLGFLYSTLLLIYTHAVTYRILEYYVPQSGKFLTLSISLLLTITLCTVLLKIFVRRKIPGGLPIFFFLLYMMFGLFSLINMYLYFKTVDLVQFTIGFYKSVLPITLVFLAYFSVYSISQGFRLLYTIAVINSLLGALGIIAYFIGESWIQYYLQLTQIEKLPLHFGGVLRMTSVLWNCLVFGILMALTGIICWNIILHHRKVRFLWFMMFAVSVIGTFASFTRTAWLVLLFGTVASSLFALRRVFRRFMVILAVSTIAALLVLNLPLPLGKYTNMAEAILGHIVASFVYENPRVEILKVNIPRIAMYPIGYGLGTTGYAVLSTMGRNSPIIFTEYGAADNNYLSMALQVGIPGLVVFMLAHFAALNKIIKRWKRTKDDREQIVLGTAVGWIVGMMVGAVLLNVWEYNLVPHIVYAVIGTALKLVALPARSEQHARLG